jgi:hypothetical protein
MEITEYTITGDDLEMLLSDIEQGGGLDCGAVQARRPGLPDRRARSRSRQRQRAGPADG